MSVRLNFDEKIRSERWLDFVREFPVAFAQVRQDSLLDSWVVDQLPNNSTGIMIASGGCTASWLHHQGKFDTLHLVDANDAQLALCELKIELLRNLDASDRLKILGHQEMNRSERLAYITKIIEKNHGKTEIFGPTSIVAEFGPDKIGRYELLFKRFAIELNCVATISELLAFESMREQIEFLENGTVFKKQLKNVFRSVMSLPNLISLFGQDATQNMVVPFAQHFYDRTIWAITNLPVGNNPYLSQLLKGEFTDDVYYPWLHASRSVPETNVQYHHGHMGRVLSESRRSFNFIHLSNILDWLSAKEATELLDIAAKKLESGGWMIIRQLNSHLNIPDLSAELLWHTEHSINLQLNDRSFFYPRVHIARKL
jgi:S-adenosylmethionine-diacylglycerol 3-amino-3-carboxypropyl transferase